MTSRLTHVRGRYSKSDIGVALSVGLVWWVAFGAIFPGALVEQVLMSTLSTISVLFFIGRE
jgi:hypothetical protein